MNVNFRPNLNIGFYLLLSLMLTSCANLSGNIHCPAGAYPGEELADSITVEVSNTGDATARNFFVDMILSTDTTAPVAYASYSPNFHEDVLLQGGREFVSSLAPGTTMTVDLYGNNKIPADTPAGNYYLGLIVDSGNAATESSNSDNTAFCALKVTACSPIAEITDAQIIEASGGTVGFARMLIGWNYAAGETPSELTITVYRLQGGSWDNIMPSDTPFVVTDPGTREADVIIFRLFTGDYRIQFNAGYSCSRTEEFTFERSI